MRDHPAAQQGLIVLGSTGTIGRLTLEVAARHPQRLRVVGLAAGSDAEQLARQAIDYAPAAVALAEPKQSAAFLAAVAGRWHGALLTGEAGICELAAWADAQIVVNGIVGAAGLRPSLAALAAGRRLALANKESLVAGGPLMRQACLAGGSEILPIDSEHCAIHQCLQGRERAEIARVVLTASGGPLWKLPAAALATVDPAQVLRHPTWRMGARITVDAATLFNKGLELIEAHWLFDLPMEKLHAVIHPQSIVHCLVELTDGSYLAQLAHPDMRLPIQWALAFPERWDAVASAPAPTEWGALTFESPDEKRFPCLRIALQAGLTGGTAPAVANAADEVLVAAFLGERIPFPAIASGLREVLGTHVAVAQPTLEEILQADAWARCAAEAFVDALATERR